MKSVLKLSVFLIAVMMFATAALAAPSAVDVMDYAQEVFYDAEELMNEETQSSPIIISSAEQFNYYANLINNGNSTYAEKYYKLSCNIDFEGKEIIPFGKVINIDEEDNDNGSSAFKGTFDGNGYAIENVGVTLANHSGVIGYMTKGTIKNLSVSYAPDVYYKDAVKYKFGGILGFAKPASGESITISGCETKGNIVIESDLSVYAGGIVSHVNCYKGDLFVTDCVSKISFDITSKKSGYVGGVVAYTKAGSGKSYFFKKCVSYGDVSYISSNYEATVGGFAGYVNKDEGGWSGFVSENMELFSTVYQFEKCAALGNVYAKAKSKARPGAFAAHFGGQGKAELSECYVPDDQVVDASANNVDEESDEEIAVSRARLAEQDFYSSLGFDFTNKWYMSASVLNPRTTAKQYGAATILDETSLRLDSYRAGLRFTAEIETVKKDYCYEYGFIVAAEEIVGDGELTLDTYPVGLGVAYDAYNDIDVVYSETDDELTYKCVIYNINESRYSSGILARTYMSYYCDGEIVTVYGNVVKSSVHETALKYYNDKEVFDSLAPEQQEMIESMLPEA